MDGVLEMMDCSTPTYQRAVKTVGIADFQGDVGYVEYICAHLKIRPIAVMGKWSIRPVRIAIRDAYRQHSHVKSHFPSLEKTSSVTFGGTLNPLLNAWLGLIAMFK